MKQPIRVAAMLCLLVMLFGALAACTTKAPAADPTQTPDTTQPPSSDATDAPSNSNYIMLAEKLEDEQFGIGFRKDDYALALAVQDAIDAIIADGSAAAISETWFGEDRFISDAEFPRATEENDDDKSLEKVQTAGKLLVGLDIGFAPMGYYDDNNEIIGFDIDFAKAVCAKLNLEMELVPIVWSAKEMELSNGKIDCIWNGMTINDSRVEAMFVSKPYLSNAQVVVVKNDGSINAIADLTGKKVSLQDGSSAAEAIEGHDVFESLTAVQAFDDNFAAFQELKTGRVDALVIDLVMAEYLLSKN